LVRDIQVNKQCEFAGKRVLLIGAGGAAEGVLQPILAAKPSLLAITNRSLDKAHAMLGKVAATATKLQAIPLDQLGEGAFDIVINATSAGLSGSALAIPDSIFAPDCLAYDMMYGRETPFMQQAKRCGAKVADGLGMLLEQAAEAFAIWRGVRPNTQALLQQLSL
jgi:shikimate dehydrogenase